MKPSATYYQDLVLVGGGHSHALMLTMWAMQPLAGVRVTLISNQSLAPYSGMLPGLIAERYTHAETHIDLHELTTAAGVRFILGRVTGIDLENKQILLEDQNPVGFDVVSINTGIQPRVSIPAAPGRLTQVKPIADFYTRWQHVKNVINSAPEKSLSIAVVGGGAAGVELSFAIHQALAKPDKKHCQTRVSLIQGSHQLLPNYPPTVTRRVVSLMNERGIHYETGSRAVEISATDVVLSNGRQRPADHIFWCTQAGAPSWPAQSGLATTAGGFVAVNTFLQSESHPFVFAAGDVAQQPDQPLPRAGVFAVRQAPVLFDNLQRYLLRRTLHPFRPQKYFLSLLECGDTAIAARISSGQGAGWIRRQTNGILSAEAPWVLRWKTRIDRQFMAQFRELPPSSDMSLQQNRIHPVLKKSEDTDTLPPDMRCGGCAAKVSGDTLSRVLKDIQPFTNDDVVSGLRGGEDAALIRTRPNQLLVQSVDMFRTLIDDPWLLGEIAAEHALSDLFAMNATPHSALAIAVVPFAANTLMERDLRRLLGGANHVLTQHQCALIGGHSAEGQELALGFSVNGWREETQLLRKHGLNPGDQLILTQPLGSGVTFAAQPLRQVAAPLIDNALHWMRTSNRQAAAIFRHYGASACTDITGFGLAGHLREMLHGSSQQAVISLRSIPTLQGVEKLFTQGIVSSLHQANQRQLKSQLIVVANISDHLLPIIYDPQTSGGLLAAVASNQSNACLVALQDAGYNEARIIGRIEPATTDNSRIVIAD